MRTYIARSFLLLGLSVGVMIAAEPPKNDAVKKQIEEDMKAFQGTWSIVLLENHGHALGKRGQENHGTVRFEKDKIYILDARRPETIRLDPTKSPKHLDTIDRDGEVTPWIYMFQGERLYLCWGSPGGKTRPKRFETATDETRRFTLLWLERDKSAPEPREKDPAKEAIEEDMERVQGKWDVIDEEYEGKLTDERLFRLWSKAPPESPPIFVGDTVCFEKDKVFIPHVSYKHVPTERPNEFDLQEIVSDKPQTFKLDPGKSPWQIDFTDKAGKKSLGIYKFEKGLLVICWNRPGEKQRPSQFRSRKEDKGVTLVRLRASPEFLKDDDPWIPEKDPVKKEAELPKEVRQDMKAMEGAWAVVYKEQRGNATPEERLRDLKVCFKKDQVRVSFESPMPHRFKLDPNQLPKQIDVIDTAGSKTLVGIYKFENGLLVICWSCLTAEKARPSEFRSGGLYVTLLRLKSAKKQ